MKVGELLTEIQNNVNERGESFLDFEVQAQFHGLEDEWCYISKTKKTFAVVLNNAKEKK